MIKRHRLALHISAWLAYMVFAIAGYPVFGISVMLPSILLCGFASWLYGYKIGLLTLALTLPYNMWAIMHNLGNPQGWRIALDPVGITAQLCAVSFIAVIKNNHSKHLELTATLESRIEQRNRELKDISECLIARSKVERSRMSETLCNIVAYQQTGLFYHSEALMNFLIYSDAPQTDAAIKLVQIAKQNMEEVKSISRRLSSQKIVRSGIEHALNEMCAYFAETADIGFTISMSGDLGEIPEETFLNIYRIAHEAVINAMRHGKATHIALALKLAEKNCTLEIINNGNLISSTPGEGLGMRLIQQRADIINAMIRLETTAKGQTRFECVIPLRDPPFHCSGIKY